MKSKPLLIIAIILMLPLIYVITSISNMVVNSNIAKNGTLTNAYVNNYVTNIAVNGENIYYLNFEFNDKLGNKHYGSTDSYYQEKSAKKYLHTWDLLIKYDENYRAVRADYTASLEPLTIPAIVATAVGILLLVLFILSNVAYQKDKKVAKFGRITVGTYQSNVQFAIVNGRPYYRLIYRYTNSNGKEVSIKTRKKYTGDEINFFEGIRNFEVKELDGRAVITEEIDYSKLDKMNKIETSTTKRCIYCGAIVDKNAKKCPSCGSNKFDIDDLIK